MDRWSTLRVDHLSTVYFFIFTFFSFFLDYLWKLRSLLFNRLRTDILFTTHPIFSVLDEITGYQPEIRIGGRKDTHCFQSGDGSLYEPARVSWSRRSFVGQCEGKPGIVRSLPVLLLKEQWPGGSDLGIPGWPTEHTVSHTLGQAGTRSVSVESYGLFFFMRDVDQYISHKVYFTTLPARS